MNSCLILVFALVVLIGTSTGSPSAHRRKLPVQVYFESLCPDSMRFIQTQLNPVYNQLKDYIDITFVPFGKSDSHKDENGNISFTCQHGTPECKGNMMQSCALLVMGLDEIAQMEFLACQMSFSADMTGETCVNQVGYSFELVQSCINSSLGTSLQLAAEKMTKEVLPGPLFWVPTIVYNWSFERVLHDDSQTHFLKTVCAQIHNAATICTQ